MTNHAVINGSMSTLVAAFAGIVANVILGASSLYWRLLKEIAPTTLLFWRIVMSLATLTLVMMLGSKFKGMVAAVNFRLLLLHALAAFLVAINWGTFILASIHGNVLESGLGYLIAPFVSIGIGFLVMRDRLSFIKK